MDNASELVKLAREKFGDLNTADEKVLNGTGVSTGDSSRDPSHDGADRRGTCLDWAKVSFPLGFHGSPCRVP